MTGNGVQISCNYVLGLFVFFSILPVLTQTLIWTRNNRSTYKPQVGSEEEAVLLNTPSRHSIKARLTHQIKLKHKKRGRVGEKNKRCDLSTLSDVISVYYHFLECVMVGTSKEGEQIPTHRHISTSLKGGEHKHKGDP